MQQPPTGSSGGAWLAITIALSFFPELEVELDMLGSRYNVDLTHDEMEVLWAQTCWTSKSLSSRVPPSAVSSPPDGVGEE
jgi:hypothetical protein